MESKPAEFSFHLVSNEIWNGILMYASTESLLRCRLVSSAFQEISTNICHSFRKLGLRQSVDGEYKFASCLQPWSCYSYKHKSYYSEEMTVLFPKYGSFLRELKVEDAELEEFSIGGLSFTPNLRTLTLIGQFKWNGAPLRVKYAPLLHLTKLCLPESLIIEESHQNWVVQIFEKSPLKEITLCISQTTCTGFDTTPLASFLQTIPSVSLKMYLYNAKKRSEFIQPIVASNIKMTSLGLYLDSIKSSNDDHTLLKLLENTADTVENLSIGGFVASNSFEKEPFKFPVLRKLKQLTLNFPGRQSQNLKTFFSDFSQLNVPALQIVKIEDHSNPPPEESTTLFQPSLVFETVVQLTIKSSHNFLDDWNRVFPSLRKLKAKIIWEANAVRMIYSFQHLEELNLKIRVPDETAEMASSLISGIPNDENIDEKSDREINEIRQVHSLPCLLQLTKLKSLSLKFKKITVALNSSVCFTLGKFEPMEKLTFTNCTMPEELRLKVVAKHECFQILEEKKKKY